MDYIAEEFTKATIAEIVKMGTKLQEMATRNGELECKRLEDSKLRDQLIADVKRLQAMGNSKSPWVARSERMPTEADCDEHGEIFVTSPDAGACALRLKPALADLTWTHWMPTPPLPKAVQPVKYPAWTRAHDPRGRAESRPGMRFLVPEEVDGRHKGIALQWMGSKWSADCEANSPNQTYEVPASTPFPHRWEREKKQAEADPSIKWQTKSLNNGEWGDCKPAWIEECEYRVKPEIKPKWRLLEVGEEIRQGDQLWRTVDWHDSTEIGDTIDINHLPHRRLITP